MPEPGDTHDYSTRRGWGYVRVSNGYAVWDEWLNPQEPGGFRRVQLRNVATDETRTLTENGFSPTISWPYVAWAEVQNSGPATPVFGMEATRLVVLNVETGERRTLQQPRSPAAFALNGQDIVWITTLGREMNLTNIQETESRVIVRTININERLSYPSLSERFITWRSDGQSIVYDRVLQRLVRLDTAMWQTEPVANGRGLVWVPKGEQVLMRPPEEVGLRSNKGIIHVVDADTLPTRPPGGP